MSNFSTTDVYVSETNDLKLVLTDKNGDNPVLCSMYNIFPNGYSTQNYDIHCKIIRNADDTSFIKVFSNIPLNENAQIGIAKRKPSTRCKLSDKYYYPSTRISINGKSSWKQQFIFKFGGKKYYASLREAHQNTNTIDAYEYKLIFKQDGSISEDTTIHFLDILKENFAGFGHNAKNTSYPHSHLALVYNGIFIRFDLFL